MSSNRHPDVEECFLPTGLPKTGQNWSHHYPTLALTFSPVCMRRGPEWGEGGHWNMQCWPGSPSEVYFPFQVQFKRILQNSLKNWGHLQGEKICFPSWKSSQTMDLLICPMTNWTGKRIQEDWPNREQAALGEHLSRLFSRTRRWELREQKNIEGSSTGAILCASLHGDQVRGPY